MYSISTIISGHLVKAHRLMRLIVDCRQAFDTVNLLPLSRSITIYLKKIYNESIRNRFSVYLNSGMPPRGVYMSDR